MSVGIHDSAIVAFVDDYWRSNWTSPTVREIGAAIGLSSPSTVHVHLDNLVRRGSLERKTLPGGRRVLYRVPFELRRAA